MPSSKSWEPGSISLAMRSRAVSRPFLCCDSMAFAPPPWRICSSSFLILVSKSTMRRAFFSNSGDLRLTLVFRTEADTRRPLEATNCQKMIRITKYKESTEQYTRFGGHCANRLGFVTRIRKRKVLALIQKRGKLTAGFFGDARECCPLAERQIAPIRKDLMMRHFYKIVQAFGGTAFLFFASLAGAQTPPASLPKTPPKASAQAAAKPAAAKPAALEVPQLKFEKYRLENGLEVILSEDHRLPMVAVNLWYHVGAANELPG